MSDEPYKLDELARAADTSPRTVRYYVQRGLLPAPVFRGKDTAYGREHWVRLRAIRRLQQAYFPLDAIAGILASRSLDQIERIADGVELPPAPDLAPEVVPPPPHREHRSRERARPRQTDRATPSLPARRTFERIELLPGLELHVAADAPPEVRRIAESLLEVLAAIEA